jgi:hypothetical protein
MNFEIKHVHDHYELFVDGRFYGSYDTVSEAVKEIDAIREGESA